jgi:undecaprenyl-diphosphatase
VLFLGYARVYVGVHYPGDIAGGIIIGAISGLLVTWIRPLAAPILTEFIATAERLHLA